MDIEVQGGAPVIRGTRVTVESVAFYWRLHEQIADVRRQFPQLSDDQIEGAIAYYKEHRDAIDTLLAADEEEDGSDAP